MKSHIVSSLLVAALLTGASFAQTPAAGTGSSSTATGAAAPKPLSETDKKFLKDAAEGILGVMHLTDSTKWGSPAGEALKKSNADITKDLDAAWGELAPMAEARKVTLPKAETSPAEKSAIEKMKKDTKNFDKNFLKALNKETKKNQRTFEAAEKSVQDPDVKAFVAKWSPKVKEQADEVAKAEDEAGKRK